MLRRAALGYRRFRDSKGMTILRGGNRVARGGRPPDASVCVRRPSSTIGAFTAL